MPHKLIPSKPLALLALALLSLARPGAAAGEPLPAPAASDPSLCSNLDVVFIIDQSNSMSGTKGSENNDPTNQRENAPKAMVDLLSDIALDTCPDASHRMAVISYGSTAKVDLPLSNIAPDTFAEAQALRSVLKEKILATPMGETHQKAGFELAAKVLGDAAPAGAGVRKRVVIFVTDGNPCLKSLGCKDWPEKSDMDFAGYAGEMRDEVAESLPFDSALLERENCVAGLRAKYPDADQLPPEEVNACLVQYPVDEKAYAESTYIYTVLLNQRGTYVTDVRDVYVDMSESHAGRVIDLSQNRSDIPTTFNEILTQLAGVKATRLACGKFAVNPYLKTARIVLFKTDESITVRLTYVDAAGVTHEIEGGQPGEAGGFSVAEYYAYGTNERYVLDTPYPGIWNLESSNCEEFDAFYDAVLVNPGGYRLDLGELPQYDREPYYDPERPFALTYQMRDEAGDVIPQAEGERFAVHINATVTDPNGKTYDHTGAMEYVPDEQLFRSTQPLQVPVPGPYRISFAGTIFEHTGEPLLTGPEADSLTEVFDTERELFRNENVEFTVFPVTPFVVEPLAPAPGEALRPVHGTLAEGWPLPVRPIQVRVRIAPREDGDSLPDLEDILADPEDAFSAVVIAGEARSGEITLHPDPDVNGEYAGQITGLDATGSHRLVVRLESAYSDRYRPDGGAELTVEFSRADPIWSRPITYRALLVLLILAVLASIAYNIAIRTNKVSGELIFSDGAVEIARFGLHSGKNWTDIGPRVLKQYPLLELRRIRTQNSGRPGGRRRRRGDPSVDDPLGGEARPGVRLTCTTADGKRKFPVELEPDLPTTYSGDNPTQVTYRPTQ